MPTTKEKAWNGEQNIILNKPFQDKVINLKLEKRFCNNNRAARNYCCEKIRSTFLSTVGPKKTPFVDSKRRPECIVLNSLIVEQGDKVCICYLW